MAESLSTGPARPEEREPAFQLIFQHVAAAERAVRVANALRLLDQGELNPAGVLVSRGRKGIVGAMVCLPVPGAGSLVWPPQTGRGAAPIAIEDQLLAYATTWLRQQGTKLAQALLTPQDNHLGASLERNGFAHITSLWYLRHELHDFPDTDGEDQLRYQTYDAGDPARFHQTLLTTYHETADCPELNGVRNIDEILEGHRAQGIYDPRRWWLALEAERPVGVLLLTAIPEWHGWDVSYLGVVPEARRKGIGRQLATKTLHEARAAGARQVTLAVDTRNRPAWNLYQGLGFRAFDHREVYLALWGKQLLLATL
jgi:ribosomal protein S18 acetylase RimI-like enzyme